MLCSILIFLLGLLGIISLYSFKCFFYADILLLFKFIKHSDSLSYLLFLVVLCCISLGLYYFLCKLCIKWCVKFEDSPAIILMLHPKMLYNNLTFNSVFINVMTILQIMTTPGTPDIMLLKLVNQPHMLCIS